MIKTTDTVDLKTVASHLPDVFAAGARATNLLAKAWDPSKGTPVYTEAGKYTTRGWTEWTQGFQFGNAIYLYDATGESEFLEHGRRATRRYMAPHVSHIGVHDHGFNQVSTYGNLLRLMTEGRITHDEWEADFYRMALKVSGAVQAARWTDLTDGLGFVHSFNGRHSLFSDTIRSMRALAVAHQLGHVLMGEQDKRISLLGRALQHAEATAKYNVYFGTGRDSYDLRGRVVHESIFNVTNGVYRCPSTQQGYSPFTTWTRGLSWVLCGFAEQLEWLAAYLGFEGAGTAGRSERTVPEGASGMADAIRSLQAHPAQAESTEGPFTSLEALEGRFIETACAVADFHIATTPPDGIPFWDTGAPGIANRPELTERPADPATAPEPVDSSAAAISAQGLFRLGRYLETHSARLAGSKIIRNSNNWPDAPQTVEAIRETARRYTNAAMTAANTLFQEPYLSTGPNHQGILLHSIYHQPNGWDYVPKGSKVPHGESCMWGDYHFLELAVYVQRLEHDGPYLTFFNIDNGDDA